MDFFLDPNTSNTLMSMPQKRAFAKQLSQEITLPDFYEDIARIIYCSVNLCVGKTSLEQKTLSVSGEAQYCILYYSEKDGNLHKFAFEQEFEALCEGFDDNDELIDLLTYYKEPDVKLFGTRRIFVTLDCDFNAYTSKRKAIVSPCQDDFSEFLYEMGKGMNTMNFQSQKLRISEDFSLPSKLPSISEILTCDVSVQGIRAELTGDEAIIKADGEISVFYLTQDKSCAFFKTSLPLTQIVDCEAISNEWELLPNLSVFEPKCACVSDSQGENRTLSVDFDISAKLYAFKSEEFQYVKDAYRTDCVANIKSSSLGLADFKGIFEFDTTASDNIDNSDGDIDDICRIRSSCKVVRTRRETNMLLGEGVCEMTILAKTQSGAFSSYEHEISFNFSCDVKSSDGFVILNPKIENITWEKGVSEFTIKAKISTLATVFCESNYDIITEIEKTEELIEEKEENLLIYYPQDNESLWDIGKNHLICTKKIAKINGLENENISNKKFLLIPKN